MRIWSQKAEENDRVGLYTDPPRSLADVYPSVPAPDTPLSLSLLQAMWTIGDIRPERAPDIAADLLIAGFDSPTLRRLAGEQLTSWFEADPLVKKVLSELGQTSAMEGTYARLLVARQVAREVIAGLRNPWTAAGHLEWVVCPWSDANSALATIYMIHDEVDWDPPYGRSIADLRVALGDAFAQLAMMEPSAAAEVKD